MSKGVRIADYKGVKRKQNTARRRGSDACTELWWATWRLRRDKQVSFNLTKHAKC